MQTFFACSLLLFLREKDNSMEIPIKVDYSAIKAAQAEIERLDEALEELVVTDSKNIEEMQRLQDALNVQKAIVGENVSAIINLADKTAGDLVAGITAAEAKLTACNDEVAASTAIIGELEERIDAFDKLESISAKLEIEQETLDSLENSAKAMDEHGVIAESVTKDLEEQRKVVENLKSSLSELEGKTKGLTGTKEEYMTQLVKEKAALANSTAAQARAQLQLDKFKRQHDELTAKVTKNNEDMKKSFASFQENALKLFSKVGLAGGVMGLLDTARSVRAEMQKMESDLTTMLGSKGSASIIQDLKQLALKTPLAMQDMVGAEKLMVSFGLDAKKSVDYIKALSDISGGESGKFNSLALAFSQASAAGKLMGQDLIELCRAA